MAVATGFRAARTRAQQEEPWSVGAALNAHRGRGDLVVPDIMEWTLSDAYLDRPNLYPRQATLLKIITLQTELLTDYDHEVIGEWVSIWEETGLNGIQPDIYERMEINRRCPCGHDRGEHEDRNYHGGYCRICGRDGCERYSGRKWFHECNMPTGRRGSKGYIGALCGSYVTWNFMAVPGGDPQEFYGIDRDKQLTCFVFAAKKDDAVKNQWGDLKNVLIGAPCFIPYVSKPLGESLSIYAPHDLDRLEERRERGINAKDDIATFNIEARESTQTAGRGPASYLQFYDEMAHAVKGVAKADIGDVYEAAIPALDQFGFDGFIYEPSSPWAMTGKFYEKFNEAMSTEEDGTPTFPQMLMVQLESWAPYKDWERAHELAPKPPERRGRHAYCERFKRLKLAIQEYDADMAAKERANPDTFAVERRAHWATVMDAYLPFDRVEEMFEDFTLVHPGPNGQPGRQEFIHLEQRSRGSLAFAYLAHGDPSKSGKNFGWAVAHKIGPDSNGMFHVVFDKLHHWEPSHFPQNNNEIDYIFLGEYFKREVRLWVPDILSFDQWNSVESIQRLRQFVHETRLPRRVEIIERTANKPINWMVAETFKTALGMGLVHAPAYEQAKKELQFLQLIQPGGTTGSDSPGVVDHPTSGPVQTKDVADCCMILTHALIGDQVATFVGRGLSELPLHAAGQGGLPKAIDAQAIREAGPGEALSRFGRRRGAMQERPARSTRSRGVPTGSPARRRFRNI